MSGHASTATLGFGVAALTIGKQISTKSSFTSPTGGSTAVYQNQKPMQSSCRCPDWSPKRSSRKSTWIMRSTYRLGIDLFLPNFNGISSSTAGFRAIFFKPPTSSWRFLLQVPLGTEDQFLEQYLNPSKREDFIEHKLPWLPETDRFDTASFREGEDCVQFAMKLGALKKNIFLLTLKKHVHDTIMILMTYHDRYSPVLYTAHLQNRLLQNSPVVGFFWMHLCALGEFQLKCSWRLRTQLAHVYPHVYQEWDDKHSDTALTRFCFYGLGAHRVEAVTRDGRKMFVVRTVRFAADLWCQNVWKW